MPADQSTVEFYDREAETYGKWAEEYGLPKHFRNFAGKLAKGASVLDFGCGGGWAAKTFHARGFETTALDPSSAMIELVSKTKGINTICGESSNIAPREFDAIWAHYSLQHIKRDSLPEALAQLAEALVSNGALFVGIHEGDGIHRDGLNRLYNHYGESEIRDLLATAGFTVESVSHAKDKSYEGHPINVMNIEARKNA